MAQIDYILAILTEQFAKKNKQLKIIHRNLKLSSELENKLEAFQTDDGDQYYVLSGTDTYFCAGKPPVFSVTRCCGQ